MKIIKNNDVVNHTWVGQIFTPGYAHILPSTEELLWANDSTLITAITSGIAIVNDGNNDLTDIAQAVNYLLNNTAKVTLNSPATLDNKPFIISTPRPLDTYPYWTSRGDSPTDPTDVAGDIDGVCIKLNHKIGDAAQEYIDFQINAIVNSTYLHGSFIQWANTQFDMVECEIRPRVTTLTASTGTSYRVVSGILVMVPPGYGNVLEPIWDSVYPVEMVPNGKGVTAPGYWDATFNTTTKKFENYTFKADGKGRFNIFAQSVEFNCFIPCFVMIGSAVHKFQSYDVSRLGHNLVLRIIWTTEISEKVQDHDWQFAGKIHLYRELTC